MLAIGGFQVFHGLVVVAGEGDGTGDVFGLNVSLVPQSLDALRAPALDGSFPAAYGRTPRPLRPRAQRDNVLSAQRDFRRIGQCLPTNRRATPTGVSPIRSRLLRRPQRRLN